MMRSLLTIIIVLFVAGVNAQINFMTHYSSESYDYGYGIVQMEDSSYAICGASGSFTNNAQAFILVVDSLGTRKWTKHYGGVESESARKIFYKENFGFLLAGQTNSFGDGDYDFYMVKTDSNGNEEWEKAFVREGWQKMNDAAMLVDTGVVLVGETTEENGTDVFVVRTDSSGDTLWTKTIGGQGNDIATSVDVYQDSLIVIAGTTIHQDSVKTTALFLLLNDNGDLLDSDTIMAGDGYYELNDMIISNDTVQAVGNFRSNDTLQWDLAFYTAIVSQNSINIASYYDAVTTGDFYADLITSYGNGAYRYVGMTHDNHVNSLEYGRDILVSRFNASFVSQNQVAQIAHEYPDIGCELIATSDGGAAMIGYREGIGIGGSSICLLKIGPNETYPTTWQVTYFTSFVELEENDALEEFSVSPNPANDCVKLDFDGTEEYNVLVANELGEILYDEKLKSGDKIDVSSYTSGLYYLIYRREDTVVGYSKLIIN
jgi:hypothetical protein